MCSTRRDVGRQSLRTRAPGKCLVAAGLFLAVLAGCQQIPKGTPGPVNPEPIAVDEAMLVRDWPTELASYPNGAVQAWPLDFWFEPADNEPQWIAPVWEPLLFVGNTLLAPVAIVTSPPWMPVIYHGVQVPPTYTAVPPLPPSRYAQAAPAVVPVAVVPGTVPATEAATAPATAEAATVPAAGEAATAPSTTPAP